jgi:hypothetical protein
MPAPASRSWLYRGRKATPTRAPPGRGPRAHEALARNGLLYDVKWAAMGLDDAVCLDLRRERFAPRVEPVGRWVDEQS